LEDSVGSFLAAINSPISKGGKVPQGIWLCGTDLVWDHWDLKKVLGSNPIGVQVKALLALSASELGLGTYHLSVWVGLLCFPK